jgi:hypothetical protein
LQSRGASVYCHDCKKFSKASEIGDKEEIEYGDNYIKVVTASKRIRSVEDAIREFDINMDEWEIKPPVKIRTHEGYRKDRSVKWKVVAGKVIEGEVDDSGKILVVPLYGVEVMFVRKTQEIQTRNVVAELIKDAKKHIPKYTKFKYPKNKDGMLYEIEMPDLQLGRLVMAEEAGEDSSPDLYIRRAESAVAELLDYAKGFEIARILIPLGNDFYDSNTAANTTAHGTPQRDDVRWQRTYRLGRQMMVGLVDKLSAIAPVDVLVIPGNHDEERIFYLGDALELFYSKNPNVTIDNTARKRKYYQFHKCLLGLTHGYYEKLDSLAALMPYEAAEMWSRSNYREFHLGDKHHKKDIKAEEMPNGVVVRLMRSLAPPSVWEFDKGFVGSLKAVEGFLWHPEEGIRAQFTAGGSLTETAN